MFTLSPSVRQFVSDSIINGGKFAALVCAVLLLTLILVSISPWVTGAILISFIAGAIMTLFQNWWKVRHLNKINWPIK